MRLQSFPVENDREVPKKNIYVSRGAKLFPQNDEKTAIFAALYLRNDSSERRHLGRVRSAEFSTSDFLSLLSLSLTHKRTKGGE